MQSSINTDDLLQFHDYTNTPSMSNSPPAQISVNSPTNSMGFGQTNANAKRNRGDPLSELMYDMSNTASVLDAGDAGLPSKRPGGLGGDGGGYGMNSNEDGAATKVSFLTIEYYQQFFNVDTFMVLERILNSMIPKRAGSKYLTSKIEENPDLYGPFWINITLIFSIAISGNIASYLQHASESYHWRYNFHLVSYAATCIFVYVNFVPAALWATFKYSLKPNEEDLEIENANYTPSLLSLMCIYGYSLAIYIPVSILWVIQISLLQWILVITAALLSGSVLIMVLTPALRNSKYSLFLIMGILGTHFLLAAGFMLYFFHVPSSSAVHNVETVTKAVVDTAKQIVNNKTST